MFIEEVLYHIDEDYRKWCDTVDFVCEEILLEDTKKKDAWFFDMSPEKQQEYIKAHPDSEKTKQLKKALAKKQDGEKEPEDKEADDYADGVADGADASQEDETLPDTVADLKQHVKSVIDAVGADLETIQIAFKQPSVYNTVKAIGGSISASSRILMGTLRTVGKTLTVGGSYIHDTDSFQKLEKGIIKTDEFMQSNPTLSKLSAVAVSGLAIGQWLRMSFSGDIESDFDLTIIPQAFAGEAGFRELIATPDGIKGMGLLSVGLATGGLPIWMGGATGLALALTYSGLQSAGETKAGKVMKERMVKWAESMGQSVEKGTKAIDKKLGIQQESFRTLSLYATKGNIEIDNMVYKKPEKLKKPKYEKLEIFEDGWQEIELTPPPSNSSKTTRSELETVIKESDGADDETKRRFINCDYDPCHYIKEYLEDSGVEFDEEYMDYITDQCTPIIKHYKNKFNRPRPYQLAEVFDMKLNKWKSGTANSPSYPSGHSMQPYLVANLYAKMYPEHKGNLRDAADICAYGRVQAGLHYPTDYNAGMKLADEMAKYLKDDLKEDAPVNATGSAVSTDQPLVRSRNKYLKKNKEDSKKIFGLLKRYSK